MASSSVEIESANERGGIEVQIAKTQFNFTENFGEFVLLSFELYHFSFDFSDLVDTVCEFSFLVHNVDHDFIRVL